MIRQHPHLLDIWVAFFELSRTRKQLATMSVILIGAIEYKEIKEYCNLYAIEDSGTLTEHIVRMDRLWVPKVNGKILHAKELAEKQK